MKKNAIIVLCLVLGISCAGSVYCAQSPDKKNSCPIILVHGMGGWGLDELPGYFYWGGTTDLKAFLEENGYEVYVASVGAVSSNWDRAIELYYQIKGGQVDYGAEHSKNFGHLQRPEGRFYDHPLYPQWDADHPVHLVGHSLGGQTIRMLSALMAGRDPRLRSVLKNGDGEPFTPGSGWIKSITTLSTPHNGTCIYTILNDPVRIMTMVLVLAGIDPDADTPVDKLYNFDLEQWYLKREPAETLEQYLVRVTDTLGETKDISTWEISIAGAQEFNERVNSSTVDPDAYYFSYANQKTFPVALGLFYLPDPLINPLLIPLAAYLGILPVKDPFHIGPRWHENDGLVNTISMRAPLLGCSDRCQVNRNRPKKGVWNYMGKLHWDHGDIIGQSINTPVKVKKLKNFYLRLAEMLQSLE